MKRAHTFFTFSLSILCLALFVSSCNNSGRGPELANVEITCLDTVIEGRHIVRSGSLVNGKQAGFSFTKINDSIHEAIFLEGTKIYRKIIYQDKVEFEFNNLENATSAVHEFYSLDTIEHFRRGCK
jgi:hypothetical protein